MYNFLKALIVTVFGFVTIGATAIATGLFNGLILSLLWKWFAAPVFHLANITIFQAWGLAVLIGFFTTRPATQTKIIGEDGKLRDKTVTEIMFGTIGSVISIGTFALVVGWILSHFV